MRIEINLYASLGRYLPDTRGGSSCILETLEGATIQDVLHQLRIPDDAPRIIFLNGVHAEKSTELKEGDRLGVFPPVAGG